MIRDREALTRRAWDGRAPDDLPAWRALRCDNVVRIWARSHPAKDAVRFEGRSVSYAELDRMVDRAASGLIAHGARVGDVVGVLADNSPEVIALLYGLVRAGVSVLPLNPRLTESEIAFQVGDAGAVMLVGRGGVPVEEIFGKGTDDPVEIEFDENLFYHVRFTGGTTGTPKCVAATHRAITLLHERTARELRYGRTDVSLIAAPVAHVAFHFAASTLVAGGTVALRRTFDPSRLWAEIDEDGITCALMVPTMVMMALDSPGEARSLRQIVSTSAAFPASLKERVYRRLPHVEVYEIYGASDMGLVSLAGPHDPPEKLGSVGRPGIDSMVRVLDDDGADCAPGEVGLVYSRSAMHTFGYVGSVPARPDQVRDGWLSVGDLGYLDEDGYLWIVDRREDLIVSGGFNVYPAEVEDVLLRHPGIEEVAVVGVPDPKWGRAVVAAVKGSAEPEDLNAHCRRHLADYKAPKRYVFLDELPKTPAMKIMRRAVRELLSGEATT